MSVQQISLPFPETSELRLRITVGACRLHVTPGDGPEWVAGSYDDPSEALPLRIEQNGGELRIAQNLSWPEVWSKVDRPPTFDLHLGKGRPYALSLEVGANEGDVDLGGLPLVGTLKITHGAGKQVVRFSAPNPKELDALFVSAGAAGLDLVGLGNANFVEMTVEGGAAMYNLDFTGAWQRPGTARISVGMAGIVLLMPAAVPMRVTTQTVLGSVELGDGFMKKEGAYVNEAVLAGGSPVLTVAASVAMGSIKLEAV